ncbi:MAG: EF-hand domain-containing protein [Planctomycetota bacterium]|nr:EF-hand domain-containing protein [Planctomycetota bacterium]
MKVTSPAALLAACTLAACSTAFAIDFGGTLTDNGAYFNSIGYNATFGDAALKAPGTASTGIDQLYKNCWYYRPSFSTTIRRFGNLGDPVSTYVGNTHTATWSSTGPFGGSFSAKVKTVLTGYGPSADRALLQMTVTITNLEATTITHNIYYALDADIGGSASPTDDIVTLNSPTDKNKYRITDSSGGFFEVATSGVNRYALGLSADTWKKANTNGFLDFTNTGSGTSGDVSGIQQWTFTLAPGQSKTLKVGVGLNTAAIIPCDGDFNKDGFLDFTDFDAFVTAFEEGSASSDFNADGFLDFTDFDAFVAAFEAGC